MRTVQETSSPRLAPPGAGLPKPELVIARLLFRFGLWRTNAARSSGLISNERRAILDLVRPLDSETGARTVLIRRLPGMEDSSRNWSVFMTLDHLRIVNAAVARTIGSLTAGRVPAGTASTASVKPSSAADPSAVEGFSRSCDEIDRVVSASGNLATPVRYAHPWFGPLDAAAWHYMAGFHMGLHRKQLVRILAGL